MVYEDRLPSVSIYTPNEDEIPLMPVYAALRHGVLYSVDINQQDGTFQLGNQLYDGRKDTEKYRQRYLKGKIK